MGHLFETAPEARAGLKEALLPLASESEAAVESALGAACDPEASRWEQVLGRLSTNKDTLQCTIRFDAKHAAMSLDGESILLIANCRSTQEGMATVRLYLLPCQSDVPPRKVASIKQVLYETLLQIADEGVSQTEEWFLRRRNPSFCSSSTDGIRCHLIPPVVQAIDVALQDVLPAAPLLFSSLPAAWPERDSPLLSTSCVTEVIERLGGPDGHARKVLRLSCETTHAFGKGQCCCPSGDGSAPSPPPRVVLRCCAQHIFGNGPCVVCGHNPPGQRTGARCGALLDVSVACCKWERFLSDGLAAAPPHLLARLWAACKIGACLWEMAACCRTTTSPQFQASFLAMKESVYAQHEIDSEGELPTYDAHSRECAKGVLPFVQDAIYRSWGGDGAWTFDRASSHRGRRVYVATKPRKRKAGGQAPPPLALVRLSTWNGKLAFNRPFSDVDEATAQKIGASAYLFPVVTLVSESEDRLLETSMLLMDEARKELHLRLKTCSN